MRQFHVSSAASGMPPSVGLSTHGVAAAACVVAVPAGLAHKGMYLRSAQRTMTHNKEHFGSRVSLERVTQTGALRRALTQTHTHTHGITRLTMSRRSQPQRGQYG